MAVNVGRGILAPRSQANIQDGAAEMRTLGATAAAAINDVDLRVSGELAQKIGKMEAYENLVPRDEAVRYGIEGPRGKVGPVGPKSDVPGPGGSIALEETDPGCFVDSEITWMQWPQSGGLPAVWNPNTQSYENPITVDTSVGTRVYVGDTMIYGDTGWRDIRSLTQNLDLDSLQQSASNIRRINNVVYFSFRFRAPVDRQGSPAAFSIMQGTLPTGFRESPVVYSSFGITYRNATEYLLLSNLGGDSSVILYSNFPLENGAYAVKGSYVTDQSWPTTEPGTPY